MPSKSNKQTRNYKRGTPSKYKKSKILIKKTYE